MLIQPEKGKVVTRRFRGVAKILARPFKWLPDDLMRLNMKTDAPHYLIMSFINAFLWAGFLFLLLLILLFVQKGQLDLKGPGMLGGVIFFAFMGLFLYYPRILVKKLAEEIDKNLAYALKDLLLQVSSGVCLFNGMANVSVGGYGEISKEFEKIVRDINAGLNEVDALERMSVRTESRFVKRTIWQLVNVMRSGASMIGALRNVVDSLILFQQKQIRDFTQELNMWSLVYMIFAVILPTLGVTLLVVLSAFSKVGISRELFIAVILVSFFAQAGIIGFVKNRRPVIYG